MTASLVLDVAGTELLPADVRRLQHPLVGGMALFARNWESRAQLVRLCAEIRRLRPDMLIAVDQEGGRVQRFQGDGFTRLPPQRALGRLWELAGGSVACEAARAFGYVMAAELRACGVDLSVAPVLDLDWGRSGVIGDRALACAAGRVATLAGSVAHGMLLAGMRACGKHFPGHGWARADSHTAEPRDARTLASLMRADAAPYGWRGGALAAVMPAPVGYSRVDHRPAGVSARWLRAVLRERLGFTGAIISDDLSMEGARHLDGRVLSQSEAVLAALAAGCDMALLCNQSLPEKGDALDVVLEELEGARRDGRWTPDAASEARRLALCPVGEALPWDALQAQPAYRRARALVERLAAEDAENSLGINLSPAT
ncbi:MAG: beta-N-acetylhexosaminidase [Ottowia sp.]|nr:beta-N-acetylhexosaminidase [Ottowia sp.]